jgi:MFS family permease
VTAPTTADTTEASPSQAVHHPSAFAPLAIRAFRGIWIANLLSNIGGWMQTTGAAWQMTSLTKEPIFVALLSAAGTLPMFLFCFLAGILADRFERKRYIIVCQFWMMGVAATLAVLAFLGQLTAWNLVALSFCMGLGNAMNGPAWHAVVPEIVSGPQLRPAIALNSAGFNLARTVGPVVGQVLLSLVGVFLLFTINACTYVGVIFAMGSWKRPAEARAAQRREGFLEAARTGIRFVGGSAELKAVFARGLCFFVPGIAMGTLLPVIGRFELKLDEFSFGVLYAVFGAGAVAGAIAMPTVNRLLGADRANIWAMGISAVATLCAALAMTPLVVGTIVTINGACWITVIANNGAAVQMILPNFMRARGMAIHQMVFFGAMVAGSLLWGKIANLWSVQSALLLSALALVPLTVLAAFIRLPRTTVPRV